jgi:Uma2 family endonuclease
LPEHFEEDKRYELDEGKLIVMDRPATRRCPDVAVILGDRFEELKNATVIPIIPEIAAEVLSPEETPRMIHRKLRQYFDARVKEVWLVHRGVREIEIWTSRLLLGSELPLEELFA